MWKWLKNEENRGALGFIAGGITVVIGGLWTLFVYLDARTVEAKTPACTYASIKSLG